MAVLRSGNLFPILTSETRGGVKTCRVIRKEIW